MHFAQRFLPWHRNGPGVPLSRPSAHTEFHWAEIEYDPLVAEQKPAVKDVDSFESKVMTRKFDHEDWTRVCFRRLFVILSASDPNELNELFDWSWFKNAQRWVSP